jgi:hypothetical protein
MTLAYRRYSGRVSVEITEDESCTGSERYTCSLTIPGLRDPYVTHVDASNAVHEDAIDRVAAAALTMADTDHWPGVLYANLIGR